MGACVFICVNMINNYNKINDDNNSNKTGDYVASCPSK